MTAPSRARWTRTTPGLTCSPWRRSGPASPRSFCAANGQPGCRRRLRAPASPRPPRTQSPPPTSCGRRSCCSTPKLLPVGQQRRPWLRWRSSCWTRMRLQPGARINGEYNTFLSKLQEPTERNSHYPLKAEPQRAASCGDQAHRGIPREQSPKPRLSPEGGACDERRAVPAPPGGEPTALARAPDPAVQSSAAALQHERRGSAGGASGRRRRRRGRTGKNGKPQEKGKAESPQELEQQEASQEWPGRPGIEGSPEEANNSDGRGVEAETLSKLPAVSAVSTTCPAGAAGSSAREESPASLPQALGKSFQKEERWCRARVAAEYEASVAALKKSAAGERRAAEAATAAAAAASRRVTAAAAHQKAVQASKAKHAASEAQRRANEQEQAAARKAAAQQADKERRRTNAHRARCRKEEDGRARIAEEEAKERLLLHSAAPASKGQDGLVAGPTFMDSKPRRKVTVGSSQRLLPPQRHPGRKTIVFDLDETLVSFLRTPEAPAGVEPGLWFRQGAVQLLQRLRQKGAEIVVWTAGGSYYAEAVTTLLDPSGAVDHIVANHGAWYSDAATYTKNVACLGRPLSSTILVDNNPQCAAKTPGVTLIVPDYEGGACPDDALRDLEKLLLGWLESDCASEAWLAQKAEKVLVDTTVRGMQRVPHLRPGTKDDRPRRVSAA
eukprot:TRINITY_DN28008_c0_g1_i2.p1 TRINITY_DN28008_c0_g1~~TRINITY_DN28008_c0_g1_i2.p1  ORF type:complete len:671 (+),score=85.08 TRINITY_DN28008_c0_g1_i2:544-2556(+)